MVPVLYKEKADCCGCGACMNICPQNAIIMREDECGFIYPEIDRNKCIECGMCKTVCSFQNSEVMHSPLACFAAVNRNKKAIMRSASGGVFAAIAEEFIDKGGIVYGASSVDGWNVCHVEVREKDRIKRLQGSKYVHSNTRLTFRKVKKRLDDGKMVLYSGTPCQIAGLQGYLKKEYSNLYTLDIICHGVPSNRMLQDYIKKLGDEHHGMVTKFTFRDKSIGWGINGGAIITGGKRLKLWQSASPFFYYFSKGWIYRENCYKCKYASSHRPADITLGDYWGIEKHHPEMLGSDKWNVNMGISAVIINTNKGCEIVDKFFDGVEYIKSTFPDIADGNGQLRSPSERGKRDEILSIYENSGWKGVNDYYKKRVGLKRYKSILKSFVPGWLKMMIKKRRFRA